MVAAELWGANRGARVDVVALAKDRTAGVSYSAKIAMMNAHAATRGTPRTPNGQEERLKVFKLHWKDMLLIMAKMLQNGHAS